MKDGFRKYKKGKRLNVTQLIKHKFKTKTESETPNS